VTPQDLEANIDSIRQAGMVLAQLEIPLETVDCLADICARENVPLMLDPAPAMELPYSIFRKIAWFTPNESEAAFYAGEREGQSHPEAIAASMLAKGVTGVLLKMGAQGVYVATQKNAGAHVSGYGVHAVDTTAAGDAFNGGFSMALLQGKTPVASAEFGAAVAAISVTRRGAQSSMPNMAEVEEFMAAGVARTA
jgi:ribokinase